MKNTIFTFCAIFLCTTMLSQNFSLEPLASGFDNPIEIQNAGDSRLFIAEQDGVIKILNADGSINTTPYLDISTIVNSGGERGLLGLAFHPEYATNGYFYVNYTNAPGNTQISRFNVSSGDPDIADANSELKILDFVQPFSNHNGGCLDFGADGYLYISTGDGGSGGDPGNRAQNTALLLGKMLRIDIDNPEGSNNYGIPMDNPFVGSSTDREEIWAYGLRNAWKFSFDSQTNDIWIADVGQGAREEINKAGALEAGLNYGWRCYEGSIVFNDTGCPPMGDLTFPVGEYNHGVGYSITGGYVYRGTVFNNIVGYYFFADFGTGIIGTIAPDGTQNIDTSFGGNWSAFGEDINGELYIANYNGAISRLEGEQLGTQDFNSANFKLYPNPAIDEVYVELATANLASVRILDLKGSVLISYRQIASSQKTIATNNLSKSIYLVEITSENGNTVIKKLLKN